MPKFQSIIVVLKTTTNFWQVPFLKFSNKKRKISFRNGVTIKADLLEYRKTRDVFLYLGKNNFKIEKSKNGVLITKIQPSFSCLVPSVENMPFVYLLLSLSSQNWGIKQTDLFSFDVDQNLASYNIQALDNSLFLFKSEDFSFIRSLRFVESLLVGI